MGPRPEDRSDQVTHRFSRRAVIGVLGGVLAGAATSTSFGIPRAFGQVGHLPEVIYIIRHAEKPPDPLPGRSAASPGPPFGVDIDGNRNSHSLSPRGWQRSGALAVLFSPPLGAAKAGLRTPTALYAASYGDPGETQIHRPYQTIVGVSRRIGMPIDSPEPLGKEAAFAEAVLNSGAEVVLISYEHHRIPALAAAIPTVEGTAIPAVWPDDRYDVIWIFSLDPGTGRYVFGQVPQRLLDGDTDTVI